ncbi:hypothetical protein ACFWPH_28215 [Nocardia sp. NPDC058499]|uniref:hypothetical protein n=1 Tax=Nocardia sp. NPDC058499 TaxID=3346530 RepID=UPI003657BF72
MTRHDLPTAHRKSLRPDLSGSTPRTEPPLLWHRWCPPPQPAGRFHARFEIMDAAYDQVHARRRARFDTAWLARTWLQHHGARAGSSPCRTVVERSDPDRSPAGVYHLTGPADEVVAALTVLAADRGEHSPVSRIPGTDTAVLSSLLDEYRWCLAQLRDQAVQDELPRYRSRLRGDIGALLATGALTTDIHRRATTVLRGADLALLIRPDGAFRAALDPVDSTTEDAGHTPPGAPLIGARYASVRHAREALLHTLHTDSAPVEVLRASIVDTRTGAYVHDLTGPADQIEDTLAGVTEFDGTLILGLPHLDHLLLLSLVLDYETRAATLPTLAAARHRGSESERQWRAEIHAQHHLHREITTMLVEPTLRHHAAAVRARLLIADSRSNGAPETASVSTPAARPASAR